MRSPGGYYFVRPEASAWLSKVKEKVQAVPELGSCEVRGKPLEGEARKAAMYEKKLLMRREREARQAAGIKLSEVDLFRLQRGKARHLVKGSMSESGQSSTAAMVR